jgi:hypothetical protein
MKIALIHLPKAPITIVGTEQTTPRRLLPERTVSAPKA